VAKGIEITAGWQQIAAERTPAKHCRTVRSLEGNHLPRFVSLSDEATSLFIYFTTVLAYVQARTEV